MWTAWYADLPFEAASRRTILMHWRPDQATPGTYAYGFAVRDESSGAIYTNVRAADAIDLRR